MSRKEKVDLCLSCVPVSTRPHSSPGMTEQARQQQLPELPPPPPPGLDHRMGDRPHSSAGFVQHTATLGSHTHSTMGNGERQHDSQTVEDGCLNPLRNKDPETCPPKHKEGICQKLRSSRIPSLYVLFGAAILLTLFISTALLAVRVLRGNNKGPACLERSTGETPEAKFVFRCKEDWVIYREKCYYLSVQIDEWKKSQDFCKSHDSSLAIIDNKIELEFLNLLKSNMFWIGLSRTQDDSGWVWTNGIIASETIFDIHRKPTDPGESEHVFLNGDGFKSESGRYPKKWICSKRL